MHESEPQSPPKIEKKGAPREKEIIEFIERMDEYSFDIFMHILRNRMEKQVMHDNAQRESKKN